MTPRFQGESDYDYNRRYNSWRAEDQRIIALNQRHKNELLRRDNGDLRAKLAAAESQNRAYQQQAQQKTAPVNPAVNPPAQPPKVTNPNMFAQQPKEGSDFSRQPKLPAQQSVVPQKPMTIPAVQKPSGGMFGSSGGSSSRSSTSRSK